MKKALIVVDYQNDFVYPEGSLYVNGAEKIKPYLEKKVADANKENILTIALKDWHPANHSSFEIWPPHAVIDTKGSELSLDENSFTKIFNKGSDPKIDSYSGFFDLEDNSNGLHEYLQANEITDLDIVGIATDVCLSATLQHAIELGYNVEVDINGIKGMEDTIKLHKIKPRF